MSLLVGGPWEHDRDEVLDYQVPWAEWLASGESVVTVEWEPEEQITLLSENLTDDVSTIWVEVADDAVERDYFAEALVTTDSSPIARVFRGHVIFRVRVGGR